MILLESVKSTISASSLGSSGKPSRQAIYDEI